MDVESLFAPDPTKLAASQKLEPYKWLIIDGGGMATTAWSTHRDLERASSRIKATVYVFVTTLASLSRLVDPQARIIVAWDGKDNRAWRRGNHPWYKHGRGSVINRQEIAIAVEKLTELITAIGGAVLQIAGREADDVVATLTRIIAEDKGETSLIFSDDKDYVQLVSDRIHLCRRSMQGVIMTPEICEIHGVPWGLTYLNMKAVIGDSGDNVKGLHGIGEVKAAALVDAIPDFLDTARMDPELIAWDRLPDATRRAFVRAGRRLVWPPPEDDRDAMLAFRGSHGLPPHPDLDVSEEDCLKAAAVEAVKMLDLVELDSNMELPKFSFPPVNLERIPTILASLNLEHEYDLVTSIYNLARMRNPDALPPRSSAIRAGGALP